MKFMMGYYENMMGGYGSFTFIGLLTCVLVIICLTLGIIYFWKVINKKNNGN